MRYTNRRLPLFLKNYTISHRTDIFSYCLISQLFQNYSRTGRSPITFTKDVEARFCTGFFLSPKLTAQSSCSLLIRESKKLRHQETSDKTPTNKVIEWTM